MNYLLEADGGVGRRKGFKKDAGTQCTRVIMHIVTFFSLAGGGTIAFFSSFACLVFSLCLFLYFYPGPKRGREGREFVIGFVDLEGLRELGDFEGCKK